MARLVKFTETVSQERVYVNPTQVMWIFPYDDGAQIVFGENHSISVVEDADHVKQAIDDANRT